MSTKEEGWTDLEDTGDGGDEDVSLGEGAAGEEGAEHEPYAEGDDDGVESTGDDEAAEIDDAIDYKLEYERKAAMVESLKKDTSEDRRRRQEAERELEELRAERAEESKKSLDLEIDAARSEWKRIATGDEDGDEIEAQEKLFRLIARRENGVKTQVEKPKPKDDVERGVNKPAEEAINWIKRNSWFRENGKLTAKAVEISKELEYEGYDVNDPDLYQELDRRLKPHRQRMRRGARPTVGGVNRGGGRDKPSGKTLSKEDKATMATFGYDWRNPKHEAMWLRRNDPLI